MWGFTAFPRRSHLTFTEWWAFRFDLRDPQAGPSSSWKDGKRVLRFTSTEGSTDFTALQ